MAKKYCMIACYLWLCFVSAAQTKKLDDFLQQAITSSPLLKDYQNQVNSLVYDSLLNKAKYRPQVIASSINSYAPVINGIGYDQAITNGGNFNALFGVNKAFPNKKNIATQNEGLSLQRKSLLDTAKITEQDLRRNITGQYITTYGDQQQLSFNYQIKELLGKEEAILKRLTEKNVYRQVDYLSFLVTLHQHEFTIKQLMLQYKNDYATLNYLCGITDTTTTSLEDPSIKINESIPAEQSIFLKKFETDSLKLLNDKAQIDINYRPKFNVYGDAGFNSTLTTQAYKNFGTSFGLSLIIPLYDGKQKKLQYSKIDLAEKTRAGYNHFAVQQYKQQIAQLQQQLHDTEDLINEINIQLKYIETLITANGKLLEAGEVKMTDYILALNNYLTAKNLVTQNINTRLQLINQLNYWYR